MVAVGVFHAAVAGCVVSLVQETVRDHGAERERSHITAS